MLRAPLLRTFLANLPIHRITGDLPPMVIVTALPLACRIAASSLSRLKLGWLKRTLAIAAEPFSHEPVLACRGARLQSTLPDVQASNLETDVEYVPRPRQWVCSFELQNRRKCCCFIPALTSKSPHDIIILQCWKSATRSAPSTARIAAPCWSQSTTNTPPGFAEPLPVASACAGGHGLTGPDPELGAAPCAQDGVPDGHLDWQVGSIRHLQQ